jgi:hypothetical protein
LHDFDKAGFSILGLFKRSNRRHQYRTPVKVIDLGLRLDDVRELGLEASAEDVFDSGSEPQRRHNMLMNGASNEEANFLLQRRVELNALPSDRLVEWIERKLDQNGVKKIVPSEKQLVEFYRLAIESRILTELISDLHEQAKTEAAAAPVPDNLVARVTARLREKPKMNWDAAVDEIVSESSEVTT